LEQPLRAVCPFTDERQRAIWRELRAAQGRHRADAEYAREHALYFGALVRALHGAEPPRTRPAGPRERRLLEDVLSRPAAGPALESPPEKNKARAPSRQSSLRRSDYDEHSSEWQSLRRAPAARGRAPRWTSIGIRRTATLPTRGKASAAFE
jgi:hypothetical protein